MSTHTQEERLARRIAELSATDPQFAAAAPDEAVAAAADEPGFELPQIVQTVLQGYADRPALGERAVEFVTDPTTGRTTAELLPRFDTITYGELWDRVRALAASWHASGVTAGDRVCILGFTSADYATIDTALGQVGAVSVPLQTSSTAASLTPIVIETEPSVIAANPDHLADAVELTLTAHAPAQLVVFDYHPEVDDHRDALAAARARLDEAGSAVRVETLSALIDAGGELPQAPTPGPTTPIHWRC